MFWLRISGEVKSGPKCKLYSSKLQSEFIKCFRFLDIVHLLVNSGAHTTCLTQEAKVTHQYTSDLIL